MPRRSTFFDDKVVWITGAGTGIGAALTMALAQRGARLIVSSRDESALNRVRDRCAPYTPHVFVLPLDLGHHDHFPNTAAAALAHFGRIDMLVNNGGISQRALVMETDFEVDRRIMAVNYLGQVALTKAVLPHMLAKGFGHIVVVSSIMGKMATPLRSGYCASKHALHGYFNALRSELVRKNIFVTLVCPAGIRTEISQRALTGDGSAYARMDPRQDKGMSPEACAAQIIRAIERRKDEVLVGPAVKYSAYINRFFPWLYNRVIGKIAVT
ncbi:MAG: SDR family oxidoreductase [Desulfobacteraceae bacterium]|nr:MAG: SDR family oxidoreductase [Desulfobacteraceae bacterium]